MSVLSEKAKTLDLVERLLQAVMVSEFGGVSCLDIDGRGNWFDVRKEVSPALHEMRNQAMQESLLPAPFGQYPSNSDVYSWFQGSTIAHHMDADGAYIAKRARFIAERACDWAAARYACPRCNYLNPIGLMCTKCGGTHTINELIEVVRAQADHSVEMTAEQIIISRETLKQWSELVADFKVTFWDQQEEQVEKMCKEMRALLGTQEVK